MRSANPRWKPVQKDSDSKRRAPRETVRNVIALTKNKQFSGAAQYLNLADLAEKAAAQRTAKIWHASSRLWEWVLLPMMLAALFGLGWAISRIVGWMAHKISGPLIRQALERSRVPLGFVAVALAAHFMLQLGVSFFGPATTILRPFLLIVMVAGLGVTALKIVDAVLDRITLRVIGKIDDTRGLDQRELYSSIYTVRRIIVQLMVSIAVFAVLARLPVQTRSADHPTSEDGKFAVRQSALTAFPHFELLFE